jgi:membrane-associated protein
VSGLIHQLLDGLLHLPPLLAYLVIGALVFAEDAVFVGFVLPGETACLIGGVLAAAHRVSLGAILTVVVLAAVVGDTVGYEVGRHLGPRVMRWPLLRRQERRLVDAQQFLKRRGGWAVFLGRFTAFLRAVMPGLAGMSRMPYPRFLAFNAAGALVWGTGVTLLGYFAGNSYARVEQTVGRASAALTLVFVGGILIAWHRARRRRARGD